jgi:predicted metal-dependent phosphoesterase TrpH
LAAVLERVKSVVTQMGRVSSGYDHADYAARLVKSGVTRPFGDNRHSDILPQDWGGPLVGSLALVIDLHTHSRFSDGSDSPRELAERAARLNLSAIALTDHDTTDSAGDMAAACADVGVEHVTGVEISLVDPLHPRRRGDGTEVARSVHVLAYFVPLDPSHPFQGFLSDLRHDRLQRNQRLIERLVEWGFHRLSLEEVAQRARGASSVGRPHIAATMFELHPEIVGERTPDSWNHVFVEWLGTAGRAYVPKSRLTLDDAVRVGASAGVVFSLAHPLSNYLDEASSGRIEEVMVPIIASLRERGVAGIEASYGSTFAPVRALMVKLTRDAGLIPTGGSDYHGTFKAGVRLGTGLYGDLAVADDILEELRGRRDK